MALVHIKYKKENHTLNQMTDNSDILICAEFKQIIGPSMLFTVPQ